MSDDHLTMRKTPQCIFRKHFVHKSQVFARNEHAVIIDDHAAAFLASVLKCVKPVICYACNVRLFLSIYAEDAAFLMYVLAHLKILRYSRIAVARTVHRSAL